MQASTDTKRGNKYYLCGFSLICLVERLAREFVRKVQSKAWDLCPPTSSGPAQ